jgi:hypothetical protein
MVGGGKVLFQMTIFHMSLTKYTRRWCKNPKEVEW